MTSRIKAKAKSKSLSVARQRAKTACNSSSLCLNSSSVRVLQSYFKICPRKLKIDNCHKINNYPLLSTLNVPFTSHTMSTLLYEIVKLNTNFPKARILDIIHPQGRTSKVINIPK